MSFLGDLGSGGQQQGQGTFLTPASEAPYVPTNSTDSSSSTILTDNIQKPDDAGKADQPKGNLLDQAREQYPVLKKHDYAYTENFKEGGGYLEHWAPGEAGSPADVQHPLDGLRPKELPMDKPGLEIRDPKTRPIDILGDITSHHLINADPVVKEAYQKLQDSMTPKQQDILKDQYQYAQKNEGEHRSFDDWKSASGMPGFLRGYTFKQWPKEFNDKAYTPEQRAGLDKLMDYLKGKK